jgi:hypothetical protein
MKHLKYSLAVLMLTISSSVFAGPPSYTLPSDQWRMISLPLTPPADENTVGAIFGDDLGAGEYNETWVLFEYNAANNSYGEHLDIGASLEPGKGYWMIQITGEDKSLDMPINSYYTKPNPYPIKLEPGKEGGYQWNLVGIPFNTNTKFSDLKLDGVYKKLWRYTYAGGNGSYEIIEGEGQLKPWDAFWTAAEDTEGSKITAGTFGTEGPYKDKEVVTWTSNDENTVFHRRKGVEKSPVVFFAPGWGAENETQCVNEKYAPIWKFITGHGYAVICNNKPNRTKVSTDMIKGFKDAVADNENVGKYINLKKIGVMGHSSGGGHSFKILKDLSEGNWGEDGRFLFVTEQWFAFGMTKEDMKKLKDTNVVFLQFGKDGTNMWGGGQDARILLTEYSLLEGIADTNKDYQIFSDADHSYTHAPKPVSEMQGILRPLDALMEYTFETQTEKARKAALDVGTDNPYEDDYQKLHLQGSYNWKCADDEGQPFDHCGNYPANLP